MKMNKTKKKILARIIAAMAVLGAYPLFVLSYTWVHVAKAGLEGGRHGPKDAYRHVLASAVVARTLHRSAVDCFTWVTESKGKDTNAMDSQNNRIGAAIGSHASSLSEIPDTVLTNVLNGSVNTTNGNQVTWLPENRWRKGLLW